MRLQDRWALPGYDALTVSAMGELRLYAIGIEEMRGMFGASAARRREHLREIAQRAFAPAAGTAPAGLLVQARPDLPPGAGRPGHLADRSPSRTTSRCCWPARTCRRTGPGATWRVLETLVQGIAWGSTRMSLTAQGLDDLDFALARGGVSAAVGLRHLLEHQPEPRPVPVHGLTVGWHPYEQALAMAGAYRSAMPQI